MMMDDKKKDPNHPARRRSKGRKVLARGFYTPFGDLDQHLIRVFRGKESDSRGEERPVASLDPSREEERLFQEAMRDVVPLSARHRSRIPSPATAKRPPSFLALEELDVKTHLMDLVRGEVPFQVTHSDEYIDGAIRGLSPKVLKKLRDGDFSYQAHLDLHGLNRMQAYPLVVQFIKESFAQKRRCVLIVSGRGLNSVEKEPILKLSLVHWLTHAPLKRLVLAFASARSYDGGAGAFYILLRRNESRHPVHVPAP